MISYLIAFGPNERSGVRQPHDLRAASAEMEEVRAGARAGGDNRPVRLVAVDEIDGRNVERELSDEERKTVEA